MAFIGPSDWS